MAFRDIIQNSLYWNKLLSGEMTTYQLAYVELGDPAGTPIRLTNAASNIQITSAEGSSQIYNAAGGLMSISGFSEELKLTIGSIKISLDGVLGTAIADLLNWPYLDRTIKIWQGLSDSNNQPIDDVALLLDGRISGASVQESPHKGLSKVIIEASSQWSDFDKKGGQRTNDSEQQRNYPGDKGFEFAAASKKSIKWGKR